MRKTQSRLFGLKSTLVLAANNLSDFTELQQYQRVALFVTISARILIQQLSLGKISFEIFAANDVTAHVEIPVGPFALIRAVNPEKPLQTLSGYQLNANAIEKNILQLGIFYCYPWFPKRKIIKNFKSKYYFIFDPEIIPLLKYAFLPP